MTQLLVDFPQTDINETFEESLIEYTILHRIRGRLRLKIPCLAWDEDYAGRLHWLILKTTVITEHRVNNGAVSLIVFYDWETFTETVILEHLETIIQAASQRTKSTSSLTTKEPDFGFPILAMITAILASPLELPFLVVGCSILVASVPLWQRVSTAMTHKGEIPVESLDALWLTAQLIQGNGIAGALALNLAQVGETLRRTQLKPMENSLYLLFEQEDQEIHWLSEEEHTDPEEWVQAVEETQFLQEVKTLTQKLILPTLLFGGLTGILTNDLARASAWLPLNVRISLQGVTPCAVDSALITAARSGVLIRNGKTLEQLAQIDTLILSLESEELISGQLDLVSLAQTLDLHIVTRKSQASLEQGLENSAISPNKLHLISESGEVDVIIQRLQNQGHKVAWVEDNTIEPLRATKANVVISLAKGKQEYRADVIFRSHDLNPLNDTLNLAQKTLSTAHQSLAIAIAGNLVAVGGGVIFGLDPIITVLINGGAAILGELNSLPQRNK